METVENLIAYIENNPRLDNDTKEGVLTLLSDYFEYELIEDIEFFPEKWVLEIAEDLFYKENKTLNDIAVFRKFIISSEYAFYWSILFNDKENMRDKVVDNEWIYEWISFYDEDDGEYEIMDKRIKSNETNN